MNVPTKDISRPRVALLIESSRAYGRGTLLGVAKYLREHRPWAVFLQERSLNDFNLEWLHGWKGDGIIARIESRRIADAVRELKIPVVDVRYSLPNINLPSVRTDDVAVTRIAFEHFLERGFRHFAYCGFNGADYSDIRRENFAARAAEHGLR